MMAQPGKQTIAGFDLKTHDLYFMILIGVSRIMF